MYKCLTFSVSWRRMEFWGCLSPERRRHVPLWMWLTEELNHSCISQCHMTVYQLQTNIFGFHCGIAGQPAIIKKCYPFTRSQDSVVGVVTRPLAGCSGVQVWAGAWDFYISPGLKTNSGAHLASYSVGTRGSFLGGKSAGAWRWPLIPI